MFRGLRKIATLGFVLFLLIRREGGRMDGARGIPRGLKPIRFRAVFGALRLRSGQALKAAP